MTDFLPLVVVLILFVGSHAAISRPAVREPLVRRLGRSGYGALNGVISTVGLALVFWAFWQAPYVELWPPLALFRAIPPLVMPFACILFVAGMTTRSAGLRGDSLPEGENPAPGILSITRHPIPWAIILWAGAHVIANGDVAGVMFFGTFLLFAAFAPMLVDRRRRLCGEQAWKRFAAASPTLPFAGPGPVDWRGLGWKRVAGGLLLFAVLASLHEPIIGLQPWP